MTQRFVMWKLPPNVQPDDGGVIWSDLTASGLAKLAPDLAEAIGDGRIISHNMMHFGLPARLIVTFVVED